ncbi:hypothetical protein RI367_004691 [Sorochytrium milnesiophthora]
MPPRQSPPSTSTPATSQQPHYLTQHHMQLQQSMHMHHSDDSLFSFMPQPLSVTPSSAATSLSPPANSDMLQAAPSSSLFPPLVLSDYLRLDSASPLIPQPAEDFDVPAVHHDDDDDDDDDNDEDYLPPSSSQRSTPSSASREPTCTPEPGQSHVNYAFKIQYAQDGNSIIPAPLPDTLTQPDNVLCGRLVDMSSSMETFLRDLIPRHTADNNSEWQPVHITYDILSNRLRNSITQIERFRRQLIQRQAPGKPTKRLRHGPYPVISGSQTSSGSGVSQTTNASSAPMRSPVSPTSSADSLIATEILKRAATASDTSSVCSYITASSTSTVPALDLFTNIFGSP